MADDTLPIDVDGKPTILVEDNLAALFGEIQLDPEEDLQPGLGEESAPTVFHDGDGTETSGDKPKLMIL